MVDNYVRNEYVWVEANPYELEIDDCCDNVGEKLQRLHKCWIVTEMSLMSSSEYSFWWNLVERLG
jgi:hypothetical protein